LSFWAKTKTALAAVRAELPPMLALALPVVVAELGWIAMSVVDTMMVGRVSPEAIGAVSIGSVLFYTIGVFGTGMLLGLDTLVPQAFGAGRLADCHRWLFHALAGIMVLGPLLMIPMFLVLPFLEIWGIAHAVAEHAGPYTRALLWSTLPLLGFMAFRHYLQAMNRVRVIMFVLVSANLVNAFANWVLIFGRLGSPEFGVEGAGWASCISRVYMCGALAGYVVWDAKRRDSGLFEAPRTIEAGWVRELARLSFPAAMQRALEIGVFAMATALVGRMDALSLAAHQVALQAASVTFMVPLGISSAAAVRVGQAIGRKDPESAHHSGWAAIALGGGFMIAAGALFVAFPEMIIRLFSNDPELVAAGVGLLYVAALFQLFDGLQVVATGALRGAGDTKTAMLANLAGHWFLGLPIGWLLAFRAGWGAEGVWVGLCIGLMAVGGALAWHWATRLERLRNSVI